MSSRHVHRIITIAIIELHTQPTHSSTAANHDHHHVIIIFSSLYGSPCYVCHCIWFSFLLNIVVYIIIIESSTLPLITVLSLVHGTCTYVYHNIYHVYHVYTYRMSIVSHVGQATRRRGVDDDLCIQNRFTDKGENQYT